MIWSKIEHPDYDIPLLGMDGKWWGNPYSSYYNTFYDYQNCLIKNNEFENDYGYYEGPQVNKQSLYKSERVCITVQDVFKKEFFTKTNSRSESLCPNNQTAIFDSHSYIKHFDSPQGYVLDDYIVMDDTSTAIPLDVTKYYKKNWDQKAKSYSQCQALQSIYLGTVVIFSFESFLIFLQAISAIISFCKEKHEDPKHRHLRIQHIVEFPLIGFFLMHILLTREEIKEYTVIDKRNSKEDNVMVRLTGAYRSDNFMYTKVKINSIICLSCFRNEECCRKTVTLGQAIIYPLILPYTKSFWTFPDNTTIFQKVSFIVIFGPVFCALPIGYFFF